MKMENKAWASQQSDRYTMYVCLLVTSAYVGKASGSINAVS